MVLIPKQKKKEPVINPYRPKTGVPRDHSVCFITWGHFWIEPDEIEMRIRVDADDHEEFFAVLEATIPREDRHRCHDHEVYLIKKEWKKWLVDTSKEYYDEVKTQLRTWN
jgi:hypothetical protein